jgi:hypothetical protein
MKYFLIATFLLQSTFASAQSSCSSDQTSAVTTIYERFTNADCESCWTTPLLTNNSGASSSTTLDWLAPSPAGEDAPLSAAANRDASFRLENLKINLPKTQQIVKTSISSSAYKIRVAHGLAVAGYMGASIELSQFPKNLPSTKNLTAVLLLTETIPKGTAGSPIERNLVRNMLIETWRLAPVSGKNSDNQAILTRRPLSIPAGVNPDNLHVFGWIHDDKGRVLAAAKTLCIEPKE